MFARQQSSSTFRGDIEMINYNQIKMIVEDSQHAGYSKTLETPRPLGDKDLEFVEINKGRKIGDEILDSKSKPVKGTKILENNKRMFQYAHVDGKEVHIESVEMYRDLWNSIHIPSGSAKFVGSL